MLNIEYYWEWFDQADEGWLVIEGSRFKGNNRASSASYIPLNHPLFFWPTVARIAPSLDSGQKNKNMRLFRVKQRPRNTALAS